MKFGNSILLMLLLPLIWGEAASQINLQWEYLDLGNEIGRRGVIVGDFDGSGYPEMFTVANDHMDIMATQFDGANYETFKKLPRLRAPNGTSLEIHSLVLMSTDRDYGLANAEHEDLLFVFDLTTTELLETLEFPGSGSSYHAGTMDLTSVGAVYSANRHLIAVHGDRENGFYTKEYASNSSGQIVSGSFTGPGEQEVAYADGSIYQYDKEEDAFVQITGFDVELTSNDLMVVLDIDGDGIDEIVGSMGLDYTLMCFSAIDNSILWTTDVRL